MAYIENENKVYGSAYVSGNAKVYGNANVYGNAVVSGDASVYGEANISSNDDWFSITIQNKIITAYKSRNADGYEININGINKTLDEVKQYFGSIQCELIESWNKQLN